eukprot:1161827-Pelagomonas_calceolata.AAC.13
MSRMSNAIFKRAPCQGASIREQALAYGCCVPVDLCELCFVFACYMQHDVPCATGKQAATNMI